jgi:ribosomal protein S18 acetylase RimI-like enzyme
MTGIRYEIIGPERFDEALHILNTHYAAEEVEYKCLDVKVDHMVFDGLDKGMCWSAIDETTNDMVGVKFTTGVSLDSLPDDPLTYEEYLQKGYSKQLALHLVFYNAIFDFKQLMLDYNQTNMLYLSKLYVYPNYRNRGIATQLVKESIAHGIKLGYKFAGACCSSPYSQMLFEKLNFEKAKEFEYATYIHPVTNTAIFSSIEDPKSVITYVKIL